jgi:ankyrin repeat protein
LYAAAKNGHVEALQTLLEAGAQVDHARSSGWTALHAAATNRHVEAIHALVGAGADLNHATNNGYTPLAMARLFNYHEAAVLALVQAGATE